MRFSDVRFITHVVYYLQHYDSINNKSLTLEPNRTEKNSITDYKSKTDKTHSAYTETLLKSF